MEFTDWTARLGNLANARLFEVGGRNVTPATLVLGVVIVALSFLASELAQRGIQRALKKRGVDTSHGAGVLGRLLHYAFVVTGLTVALQTAGIEVGALFAAGAVFAVGIGFAMQNIAQNFVSGVILLVERTIRPGDILEVEGSRVRVVEMGIRATLVRTLDEELMIVPNSTIVQSTVKNYTLKDRLYRARVTVGVTYSSDMDRVEATLVKAAAGLEISHQRDPVILLSDFADSSVNWQVSVWIDDPWIADPVRSQLRRAIWNAFQKEGIVIAFPQLDLHLDPPIEKALARRAA